MKKEYTKPTQQVVVLQYQQQLLLNASLTDTVTNLGTDDNIGISDTPGTGWGR